jgi:poly-gamma-glutamate synthesis protein (capsule biosynthesis protein)
MVGTTIDLAACETDCAAAPFPSMYADADVFREAIAAAETSPRPPRKLSGVTVPHHLLVADLIAHGMRDVDKRGIDRIIVLFPDHFKKTRRPFATTRRDFETVFGMVRTDRAAVEILLQSELVEHSGLFAREHGLGALLPFIRHFFSDVPIVPIAIAIRSNRTQWDRLAGELAPLIGPSTLIIQSTDFSHYLPAAQAVRHDQVVLNALASSDLDAVARMRQPDDLDSRGAQYLQLKLQQDHFRARPVVLFNSNSQARSDVRERRTTSYIVQTYQSDSESVMGRDESDSKVYCFAGDTFFGRGVARVLSDPHAQQRLQGDIGRMLNNCRLILNLEGVTVGQVPQRMSKVTLAMPAGQTLRWLRQMKVLGVGVANNHRFDLGAGAFEAMVKKLRKNGFTVLPHGRTVELGALRVVALTDLDNRSGQLSGVVTEAALRRIKRSGAERPLVAFMHWGTEWQRAADDRQQALASILAERGATLIVGAHPHVADLGITCANDCRTAVALSLGNFLFDQSTRYASGGLLEVRVFSQGTIFARVVPIPNYFDRARQAPVAE